MAAKRKKRSTRKRRAEKAPRPAPLNLARPREAIDARPEVTALFTNLKASKTKLNSLLLKCSGDWSYFDPVYRFYHQSFKVFGLQSATLELVGELQALAPERKLNARFMKIVTEGTGKTFELENNRRWDEVTRPIIEAFFHAASSWSAQCARREPSRLRRRSCQANGPPCSTSSTCGRRG